MAQTAHASTGDSGGMNVTSVPVRCPGCGHTDLVASRSQFSVLDDLHRAACDVDELDVCGSANDLLDLPPFDGCDDDDDGIAMTLLDVVSTVDRST